jgi:nicotinamidase-related amidase
MDSYTNPDFERSALVIIDTQNDFTLDQAPARVDGTLEIIPNLVRLLALYRERSLPVIHVVRLYFEDGSNADLCRRKLIEDGKRIAIPGSIGAELVEELMPDKKVRLEADRLIAGEFQQIASREYVMYKSRWGAFYQTEFERFLNEIQVNTLVIAGCNFPNCPRTSIYEASERNFRIVLVRDAVSQIHHKDVKEMRAIAASVTTTAKICSLFNIKSRAEKKIQIQKYENTTIGISGS